MDKAVLYITITCCLLGFCKPATAQYYFYNSNCYEPVITWETGAYAGGMNCLTDLGGKKTPGRGFICDANWRNTRLCGGWYAEGIYHAAIGARAELAFGQVTAFDSILKSNHNASHGRYVRNLSFRSDIMEAALMAIVYPLALRHGDYRMPALSPYLVAGAGYFSFNPQAFIHHAWIPLQPLHTEGQGSAVYPGRHPYRLRQFCLPAGIGVTWEPATLLHIRAEVIYRKLWTDYLDDVSTTYIDPQAFNKLPPATAQLAASLANRHRLPDDAGITLPGARRGNPANNDAYFSFNLKIALVLGRQKTSGH